MKAKNDKSRGLWRRLGSLLTRVLLYGTLLCALAAAILSLYLQSREFEVLLAERIEVELQRLVDRPVSVGGLSFDLLGGRIVLVRLRIGSGDDDLPDPVLIDTIWLHFRHLDLLAGRLTLDRVSLWRPEIDFEVAPDGRSNIPVLRLAEHRGLLELRVKGVDAAGGVLRFRGKRIGWGMESGGLSLTLRHRGGDSYDGTVDLRNLRFELPEFNPLLADLSLRFSAGRGSIGGTAAASEAGGSRVKISRWKFDYTNGDAEFEYDLHADLGLLRNASEAGLQGRVDASGRLSYTDGVLEMDGSAELPELRLGELGLEDLHGRFRLRGDSLYGEGLKASAFEGSLAGNLRVSLLSGEPKLEGSFEAEGIALRRLLEALRYDAVRVDGTLSANFSMGWEISRPEELTIQGSVRTTWDEDAAGPYREAVERLKSGPDTTVFEELLMPVAAVADFEFRGGRISIGENAAVRTPLSEISLNGTVWAEGWRLDLSSDSLHSAEVAVGLSSIDRLLGGHAGPPEDRYPIASFIRDVGMEGSAEMELRGRLDDPVFRLHVKAPHTEYLGRSLGSADLRLGYAGGEFLIESLRLRDAQAMLGLHGRIAFPEGGPSGELTLEATNFELEGIEKLFGLEPVGLSGLVSGSLELRLGPDISGGGEISARDLHIGELQFTRASAKLRFGDRWSMRDLEAVGRRGGSLRGSVDFNPRSEEWSATLKASALELERYAELFGGEVQISGLAEIDIDAGGKGVSVTGELDFSAKDLRIGDLDLGDVAGNIRADGRTALISYTAGERSYQVNARLSDGDPQELYLEMEEDLVDLTALAQLFIPDERFYLQIRDGISMRIPLGAGEELSAYLTAGRVDFGMEQFSVTTRGAVRLELTGSRIRFRKLRLEAGRQQAVLAGWVELGEEGRLNLNLDGGLNLLALSDFFQDFSFSGRGIASLRLRGTVASPELFGSVAVTDAFLRHKETDIAFSNISGRLRINGSRVEVNELTAVFAEGVLDLDGFFDMDWAELQPGAFQFDIRGSAIRARPFEGLEATLDGSLIYRGGPSSSVLTGEIGVRRALYSRRFDPEAELIRLRQRQPLPIASEELRNVRLDLGIKGEEGIVVDNNFAEMAVAIDLRLVGSVADPVLIGRAEVLEGEIFYRDRKYEISTGVIDFVNPYQLEPRFDFRAETQVKEYQIFLEFHGTLDRLFPELASDPPESTIDILNLLAVGKVRDNPFPSDTERLQERLLGLALSGFITKQVTGALEKRAERLFGVDRFRIDPFFPGGSNNLTPRITIGEQLTDRISVIYSRNISESEVKEEVLLVEYRLSPTMLLIGSRDEDGSFSVDLHVRHRFR